MVYENVEILSGKERNITSSGRFTGAGRPRGLRN